jgi:ligand-binding sensor domain-containing protein
MQRFLSRYLTAIFFLKGAFLLSQQYYFKNYSSESGLPFVQVFCMYQDSKGYLWSGGYGGLSRFDGKQFLNFSQKNGLINHYVNAICEDDSGKIYVGTVEGLSILKGTVVRKNYDSKNGLPERNINTLCFIKDNGVFIGTKKGLYLFNGNSFTNIKSFKGKEIKCLLKKEGILWIGTNNGLFRYNLRDKSILKQEGLGNNNINCLASCEGKNDMMVGTANGLAQIDAGDSYITNFHVENGLIDETINSLLCESPDNIWIASSSGLLNFNGKQFSYYNIYNENNANHIRCMVLDKEENLWLGTHSGLYRYRDNAFSTFKEGGIANAVIFQTFRDTKGDLWFCTEAGIYKYSQGFFKLYTTKDGLVNNNCNAALEDDDGTIWFCTVGGISWYKNGTFRNFTPAQGFQISGPLAVAYKDSKGIVWVGGKNGMAAFKKTNGVYTPTYYKIPTLSQEYGVTAFVEDKKGGLWLGTFLEGLYKFENNAFVYQSKKLDIDKPESFFTLLCDKNNTLYAATLNGLWIYNIESGERQLVSEKDGLNSELLYSLKFDKTEENIWIGTNQGINKMDLLKFKKSKMIDITSFGKAEGFTGGECNSYAIWQDNDDTWWFGTVTGIVRYKPTAFKKNSHLSQTYIQSIKLSNEDTLLKNGSLLPYNFNNIAFYYRGICLTNPDKVLYSKTLEGFESKWSEPSTEDYSKYANLPPGKYTFKVKSCNNEGVWDIVPAEFTFEIKTPFFKTWWFICSMIGLTLFSILGVFRLRIRNIRKQEKAEFDRQVEISKVELKALRAQMNPHFVFNSLNSIQHYILNNNSTEAAKYLNKFAKLIRTILNNSEKPLVTVNEDVESLTLYLELEQMRFDEKFDYSVHIDKNIDGDFEEIPPMLMQPYLENAILHGLNPKLEKGHLRIDIFSKNGYIVCRITDNGIGRESSGEIKRTRPGQQHKSLGMKITSERVRILNAINRSTLSVSVTDIKNEDGKSGGTMVELYIPQQN